MCVSDIWCSSHSDCPGGYCRDATYRTRGWFTNNKGICDDNHDNCCNFEDPVGGDGQLLPPCPEDCSNVEHLFWNIILRRTLLNSDIHLLKGEIIIFEFSVLHNF